MRRHGICSIFSVFLMMRGRVRDPRTKMSQNSLTEDMPPPAVAPVNGPEGDGLARLENAPLDDLLVSGGDPRLALDPETGLNLYGCAPHPVAGVLSFASSTASVVSERAYARAARARDDLLAAARGKGLAAALDARLESLRGELKECLGLAPGAAELVFSPSGTDGQLLALFAARASMGATASPLTSIVVAANETGGGTVCTARGRHFGTRTAQGVAVDKETVIKGLGEDVEAVDIPARDARGRDVPADEMDRRVTAAVAAAVARGRKVMLQAMDSSKLGRRAPGRACLREIAARWPDGVRIVIDACQMRLSRARLARYLEDGCMVLMTGSKFFTGPPFSGALLLPPAVAGVLAETQAVPAGLHDYTNAADWPAGFSGLRAALPARTKTGAWLRWEAALCEMKDYFSAPEEDRRAALDGIAAAAAGAIAAAPEVGLLPMPPADAAEIDGEMAARTIFAFYLLRDGRRLSAAECRAVYHALNRDVSALLPPEAAAGERALAAQRCYIGQPVALGDAAVLRINAGARMITDGWRGADVARTLAKLALLLARPELTENANGGKA